MTPYFENQTKQCRGMDENVKMEKWVGDPQNPGFVYIPSDYVLLNDDENSPWFETEIFFEE